MIELKPGCHYFMAIQRGTYDEVELEAMWEAWKKAGIGVSILRTYDRPDACMAFTEKEQAA